VGPHPPERRADVSCAVGVNLSETDFSLI
jgi:hypothetical protein